MPSLELMELLNVKAKGAPTVEQVIRETHPIDGQTALQMQPQYEEVEDTEYQPYDLDARKSGWLVLQSNQMYNAQPFRNSEVFIMRTEDDTWEAWRETWREGTAKSISTRNIAKGVPFHMALNQATGYIKVLTKRK